MKGEFNPKCTRKGNYNRADFPLPPTAFFIYPKVHSVMSLASSIPTNPKSLNRSQWNHFGFLLAGVKHLGQHIHNNTK